MLDYKYKEYLLVFTLDNTNSFYIGTCDELGLRIEEKLMKSLLDRFKKYVDNL